jgi:hypothetical protein
MRSNCLFENIHGKNFELSIQASSCHYCCPRIDGLNPNEYTAFEVCIYKNERTIPNSIKDRFASRYDEYCDIIAYVTPDELNWIYEEMERKMMPLEYTEENLRKVIERIDEVCYHRYLDNNIPLPSILSMITKDGFLAMLKGEFIIDDQDKEILIKAIENLENKGYFAFEN